MSIESTVASPPRVKRPGRRMDAPIPASSPAAMPQPGVIKPLSLRRNFSWTLAGNLVNAACQWGVIVVLAKLGSPEMVGRFALALAIVTPILTFTNLQLRAIQATDARREAEFGHYFALRLLTTLVALAAIAGVALLANYRAEVVWAILLVGLARAVEAISDVFHGFYQQHERLDFVAVSFMAKGPLSLLLIGGGVAMSGSLVVGLVGLVLSRVLSLLVVELWNAKRLLSGSANRPDGLAATRRDDWKTLFPCWNWSTMTSIAWRAFPLGVTMLLLSLNTSIPRFFLESRFGERELGIFASLAYFIVAGTMIVSALGQAATPRLAKYHADRNDRAFRNLLHKMTGLFLLIGLLGILVAAVAGRTILSAFYEPEYAEYSGLFVGVMIAGLCTYLASAYGYAATASRRIQSQPIALAAVTFVSLIGSWLLVGQFGLTGAVAATLVTSVALCVSYRLLLPLRGRFA